MGRAREIAQQMINQGSTGRAREIARQMAGLTGEETNEQWLERKYNEYKATRLNGEKPSEWVNRTYKGLSNDSQTKGALSRFKSVSDRLSEQSKQRLREYDVKAGQTLIDKKTSERNALMKEREEFDAIQDMDSALYNVKNSYGSAKASQELKKRIDALKDEISSEQYMLTKAKRQQADDKTAAYIENLKQNDNAFERKVNLGKRNAEEFFTYKPNTYGDGITSTGTDKRQAADIDRYNNLSDQEKTLYHYYMGTDKKAADKYLENLKPDLNARVAESLTATWQKEAEENPVGASIASIATNLPFSGLEGAVYSLTSAALGKEIDPNSEYFTANRATNAYRNTVAGNIEKNVGGSAGQALSFLYNTGMSMADSAFMPITGGVGLAGMGVNAGTDTIKEAKERGASNEQALIVGGVAAVAETLFEKVSLDSLIKLSSPAAKNATIKNILKQSFTEASEETLTEITNTIADTLVMGDLSNYNTAVKAYMAQGMGEEEARKQATIDTAKQIGLAALGGGISGGAFGAAGSGVSNIRTRQLGANIIDSEQQKSVIDRGLNTGEGTRAYEIAKQNEEKYTKTSIGRQYMANLEAVQQETNALTESMRKAGASEAEINTATNAVYKVARGGVITEKEASALLNNDNAWAALGKLTGIVTKPKNNDAKLLANSINSLNGIETKKNTTAKSADIAANTLQKSAETPKLRVAATNMQTGTEAEITSIASIGNGEILASMSDGSKVNIANLDIDPETRTVINNAKQYGIEAANSITAGFAEFKGTAEEYNKQVADYYAAGRVDAGQKTAAALSAARNAYYGFAIPEYAANAAYKAGVKSKLPKVAGTTSQAKNKPGGKFTNEYTGKKTKTLKREFQILESYAKEAGVNIRVVDGIEDANGKQSEAHEGYYNPKTNEIVLSVKTGEDKLLYVAGHELVHRTRAYSEEAYNALRDIVLEHLNNVEGYDLEARISEIQAVYKSQGIEIGRDGAMEEIVAKSYAQALSDGTAVANIASRDKRLFEKIRRILNEICDTFDRIAKRIAASDTEASAFLGEVDTLKEMRDTFFAILDNMGGENEPRQSESKHAIRYDKSNTPNAEIAEIDEAYMAALEKNDMGSARRLVERAAKIAGYTVRAYHGTSRADRVGNVFRADRATSGPMAFFTDNRAIAENYSRDKRDTSLDYETSYDTYETQFRASTKKGAKYPLDMPVHRAWGYIDISKRNEIRRKAGQLRLDWDGDGDGDAFILDTNTQEANGDFQWQLKKARGNVIAALEEQWLNSGTLFNEEVRFLEVLEIVGVKAELERVGFDLSFKDPNYREEKVYDTYLCITKPFDATKKVTEAFIKRFENWADKQPYGKYDRESVSADMWDKNDVSAEAFAERMRYDVENGTSHAWTSIPDIMTDYLKHLRYDGIMDAGGKNGGASHTVYIPFSSEQVKSADVVTYNDKGEAIPLSERFNPKTKDIRYAIKDIGNAEEALLHKQISMPKAQYDRRYRLAIKHNNDIIENGDLPKLSYIIDGNYAYIYMNFDDYFTIDGDDPALIFVEKAKVGSHKYDNIIEEVNKYVRREGIVQAREQRGSFYRSDIRNSGSPKERGDNESAYTDVQGQPGTDGRGVPEESEGDILQPGRTPDSGGRGGVKFALSPENTNDSLNKLTDEYGAIEQGENPARDIAVPKQTSKYKKVRRFTRTVLESGNITDEMIEPIKEQILEEAFSYVPISDEAARTSAESTIATLGTERAHRKWMSAIDSNKVPTKEDIALGEYLLVEAAKNGNARDVVELTAELAEAGTRAGQAVQAMRMLKKLDGMAQLVYIQRAAAKLALDAEKRAKRLFGKKFNGITINEDLALELATAKTESYREVASDRLMKDIADQLPVTFMDKWNAWRYLSMLGNPKTHFRNILGNAIFYPTVKIKDAMAAGIEKVLLRGDKKALRTKALKVDAKYKEFARQDFENIAQIITGGGKYNPTDDILDKRRIFKTGVLEKLREWNGKFLEGEDIWFLRRHYARALSGFLQARNLDLETMTAKQLEEARSYAILEAQKATYRDASKMANALMQLSRKNRGLEFVMEGLLPFKKTPINILKRGIEYSPAGLINALAKGIQRKSAAEIIDSLAAGLTGTAILALGAFLKSIGFIEVGLGDDKEDEFKKLQGEQGYSIRIGGYSFTVDWLAPMSMPMFAGAELMSFYEESEDLTFADIYDSFSRLAAPIVEMSMLSGISNLIDSLGYSQDPGEQIVSAAETIATNYLTQGIPTLFGQIARSIDDTQRRSYVDKNSGVPSVAQLFVQKVQKKVPGLSYLLEPRINEWGEEDVQKDVGTRLLENFISPSYIEKIETNSVEKEINKLYEKFGETDILPSTPSKYYTKNGVRKDLSAEDYTAVSKIRGQLSYEILNDMFKSSEYKKLTDDEKMDAIKKTYDFAKQTALVTVTDDYEYLSNWMEKASKSSRPVYKAIIKQTKEASKKK